MRGKSPAQAQHKIREMFDALTRRGADVKFGIHPGRAVFALVRIFPTKIWEELSRPLELRPIGACPGAGPTYFTASFRPEALTWAPMATRISGFGPASSGNTKSI